MERDKDNNMFNEERKQLIVKMVEQNGRVSVQELVQKLDTSESTIRRDLTELDKMNLITKVHGGAISVTTRVTQDVSVTVRKDLNQEQKLAIARYAASLVTDDDIVFLDAGTTTGLILNYLDKKNITLVTNSIEHATMAASRGFNLLLPGGTVKKETQAIVGHTACKFIEQMNFTKCFMGTNGVTRTQGCTTPDATEAEMKRTACEHSKDVFILADNTKFGTISTVTFCKFEEAEFITDETVAEKYYLCENVTTVH